jgi:uncharacterized protein (TIGR02001 family)
MKKLIKLGAIASLVMAMPVMAQDAGESAWSFSGNVTGVSDYVFRGISQTSESPAAQGALNVGHSSGFYGFVWGSNVDFDVAGDGISVEVDYGLGWNGDVGEGVNLDLSAVRYTYPGSNSGFGIDYNEYLAKVTVAEHYYAMIGYADDYANTNESATYYQVGTDWDIGETGVALSLAAGLNDFDNVAGDRFWDFQIGFSKDFGPVNLGLSYIDTAGFSGAFTGRDIANSRVVLTASYDFDL